MKQIIIFMVTLAMLIGVVFVRKGFQEPSDNQHDRNLMG